MSSVETHEYDLKVTLLGTGHPYPSPERFGPSTLVEAGNVKLLVDAGRGATIRLWQLGISLGKIDRLLLTHYHSDHISGVPDLWLTGWLSPAWGARRTPFRVIRPIGAKNLMTNLEKAYAADIAIRLADEHLVQDGIRVDVEEFDRDGVIFSESGLKVIAFEVDHGELIKPCYGYRFEFRGRSAVISSDTRYNENVIKFGTGADLLVHEVCAMPGRLLSEPKFQRIMAHHTTPEEAGLIFSKAKPKLAAFTHLVMLAAPQVAAVAPDDIIAAARTTYDGPLVIGDDLMSFEIGETVKIVRRSSQSNA